MPNALQPNDWSKSQCVLGMVFSDRACSFSSRRRILSQMPRSFAISFQFVPTGEQTFLKEFFVGQ
jgi:hypothetical protein